MVPSPLLFNFGLKCLISPKRRNFFAALLMLLEFVTSETLKEIARRKFFPLSLSHSPHRHTHKHAHTLSLPLIQKSPISHPAVTKHKQTNHKKCFIANSLLEGCFNYSTKELEFRIYGFLFTLEIHR